MMEYKTCTKEDLQSLLQLRKRLFIRYEDPTTLDIEEAIHTMISSVQGSYEAYTKIIDNREVVGYYHISQGLDYVYDLSFFYVTNNKYTKPILEHILQQVDDAIQITVYMKQSELIDTLESLNFKIKESSLNHR